MITYRVIKRDASCRSWLSRRNRRVVLDSAFGQSTNDLLNNRIASVHTQTHRVSYKQSEPSISTYTRVSKLLHLTIHPARMSVLLRIQTASAYPMLSHYSNTTCYSKRVKCSLMFTESGLFRSHYLNRRCLSLSARQKPSVDAKRIPQGSSWTILLAFVEFICAFAVIGIQLGLILSKNQLNATTKTPVSRRQIYVSQEAPQPLMPESICAAQPMFLAVALVSGLLARIFGPKQCVPNLIDILKLACFYCIWIYAHSCTRFTEYKCKHWKWWQWKRGVENSTCNRWILICLLMLQNECIRWCKVWK